MLGLMRAVNLWEVGSDHYALTHILTFFHLSSSQVGRYCELMENEQATDALFNCGTREEYETNLYAECHAGEAGTFTWVPDNFTPNLVYYQVSLRLKMCSVFQSIGVKRLSIAFLAVCNTS